MAVVTDYWTPSSCNQWSLTRNYTRGTWTDHPTNIYAPLTNHSRNIHSHTLTLTVRHTHMHNVHTNMHAPQKRLFVFNYDYERFIISSSFVFFFLVQTGVRLKITGGDISLSPSAFGAALKNVSFNPDSPLIAGEGLTATNNSMRKWASVSSTLLFNSFN